jgi:AAA domain/DnaB-like helicase N terminal domain
MAGSSRRWWSTVSRFLESEKWAEPQPAAVDHNDAIVRVERSALGCIVECPELVGEVDADPEDCFLLSDHRVLWRAMVNLHSEGIAPDTPLLAAESRVDVAYIAGLVDAGYLLRNFRTYIARIREAAKDRHVRRLAQELTTAGACDRPRLLQQIEKELASVTGKRVTRSFADVEDVLTIPVKSDVPVCRDLLEPGAVTMVVSSPGVGKSFLTMSLAVSVALGGTFLDRQCTPTRVMMFDRENPLRLLQKRLRLIAGGTVANLKVWCGASADPPPMIGDPRILEMAREQRTLFIFDTLTRFHNANENSATGNGDDDAGMRFVTGQARLLANLGSSVLILHHRGKGAARYRGSEEILANVDTAFELVRNGQNGRKLHNFKNRDGEDDFDISISYDFEHGVFTCTDTSLFVECKKPEEVLQTLIERNPGICVNKIAAAAGLRRNRAIRLLQDGEGRLWRSEAGLHRSRIYFPLASGSRSVDEANPENSPEPVPTTLATGSRIDSHCTEPLGALPLVPKTPPLRGEVLDREQMRMISIDLHSVKQDNA